jgi:outer membrane protein assembly factor BamA
MRQLALAAAAIAALALGGWYVVEMVPGNAAAAAIGSGAAEHPQQIRSLRLDGDRLPVTILGAKLATKVGDTLDMVRLIADRQALRDTLVGRGYWAAEVSAPDIVFGDDGGAHITIRIATGPVFHVRDVAITGDRSDALRSELTLAAGDDVSPERLARNADLLASFLRRSGAPSAEVTVETTTDLAARAVDVRFVVSRTH